MQRVVEHAGKFRGAEPTRGHEIRTANVADEQRITRQDSVGLVRILRQVVDQNGNRLRRVAWGFEHGESDLSKRQHLTVPEGGKGVVSLRPCPQTDGSSRTFV